MAAVHDVSKVRGTHAVVRARAFPFPMPLGARKPETECADCCAMMQHSQHAAGADVEEAQAGAPCQKWNPDADSTLRFGIEACGQDWVTISARFLPRYSPEECRIRWKVLSPVQVKGAWSSAEDEALRHHVLTLKTTRWSAISLALPGRNGKQCRERWHNHLKPDINKDDWTREEDAIVFCAHAEMGNKWTEIARRLNGRTDNQVKNRWNSTLSKQEQRAPYLMPSSVLATLPQAGIPTPVVAGASGGGGPPGAQKTFLTSLDTPPLALTDAEKKDEDRKRRRALQRFTQRKSGKCETPSTSTLPSSPAAASHATHTINPSQPHLGSLGTLGEGARGGASSAASGLGVGQWPGMSILNSHMLNLLLLPLSSTPQVRDLW